MSDKSSSTSNNYINLHTSGLGYISRVREVAVRKGKPFMSATIRAMHGEKDSDTPLNYVPFDVKAVTAETQEILKLIESHANNRDFRVMVQFKIGDFYIDSFRYSTGEKAGQTGTMLKGRLLQIYAAWVKKTGTGSDQTGWINVYERKIPASAEQQDGVAANGTEG